MDNTVTSTTCQSDDGVETKLRWSSLGTEEDGVVAARKSRLEDRVMRSIRTRVGVVILRSELSHLGGPSQLTRVLARLVATGQLIRVGQGIYAKTRMNRFTGTLLPAAPFEAIAAEAFRKLGIDIGPGALAREYNAGRSTQLPMVAVVTTGRRRITRRIQVGSKSVTYERVGKDTR
ncbi:S-adenosylhomocysteine hydrolase [Burkholderia ubonensis]|nr:S-adenosylhomocysteine hydrolase [Burkholderia ubonensis]RQP73497.1 S-adenosylhomocysteine hydrolase [Burkholderia ubonensis]